jgi:dephospho-CoA kinase
MHHNKPIIGILGGIGSGKSFVAEQFKDFGCLVIHADELAAEAYRLPEVRETLEKWWGKEVFNESGGINRKWIAGKVFNNPPELERLEGLIHPKVRELRDRMMETMPLETKAVVWDIPLLVEVGLDKDCDVMIFVDVPETIRIERVVKTRGWTQEELSRRDKIQIPLDKKRKLATFIMSNTAGADEVRCQIRQILPKIVDEDCDSECHDGDCRRAN